jgi:hypothetical protein
MITQIMQCQKIAHDLGKKLIEKTLDFDNLLSISDNLLLRSVNDSLLDSITPSLIKYVRLY